MGIHWQIRMRLSFVALELPIRCVADGSCRKPCAACRVSCASVLHKWGMALGKCHLEVPPWRGLIIVIVSMSQGWVSPLQFGLRVFLGLLVAMPLRYLSRWYVFLGRTE